ncbi:unnamed protein product [Taenia asiatica]|uniref:LRRcap domain-containing protein n=1 Tax=Taenia asiatica TaxID=60517 RepID=A0A158R9Q9_TAEAS|nr:unnamed protein product [Taenia asiatica]
MIGHRLTESMILRRAQKENLEHVKRVNLCSNNISSLEAFSFCVNLKELYLRNNAIFDLNEVRHLSSLNFLHTLFLLGNPCCYPPNVEKIHISTETSEYYRPTVIKHVPSLERLDLSLVSEDEKMAARQSTLTPSFSIANDVDDDAEEEIAKGTEIRTNVAGNNLLSRTNARKEEIFTGDSPVVALKGLDCPDPAVQESQGFASPILLSSQYLDVELINHPRYCDTPIKYAPLPRLACLKGCADHTVLLNSISRLTKSCSLRGESLDLPSSIGVVESIRQTISHLSLVNKQALTEILHLLPRLNDDALTLLANEVENRRRHQGERLSPASSARDTSP